MIRENEHMVPRERVKATFAYQKTDRVPINYHSNPGIDARLKAYFGLNQEDNEGLLEVLGVDFRAIGVPYIGPRLHKEILERNVDPEWGIHTRWIEHGSGGYWDFCDFPLRDADEDMVKAWSMPTADDYDYSGLDEACKRNEKYALYVGDPGLGCIMNTAGFFRSMEQMFIDLATDEPAGLLLIDRFLDLHFKRMEHTRKGG